MYKVYFDDGYPIVSLVIRASSKIDSIINVSYIVGESDAYNKIRKI